MNKQIAILGGSFDPPTIGHAKLAQFVLDSIPLHEIWITPCYNHMYDKSMAQPHHRINMCNTINSPNIKTSTHEIDNQSTGSTYSLISQLIPNPLYENCEFSIIIGMDNANTFHKWHNYQLLQKLTKFIVVTRKGIERDPNINWYLQPPHVFLTQDNSIPEVSSTLVKQLLKENNPIVKKLIHPKVLQYIQNNNLYL